MMSDACNFMPAMCLQTTKGTPAKGITSEELVDMMKSVWPHVQRQVASNPTVFPKGMADLKIIMDGSGPNQRARYELGLAKQLGLEEAQILWHPAYSPDFQSPIEQSWSRLNAAIRRRIIDENRAGYTLEEFKELILTTWSGSTDPPRPPLHKDGEVEREVENMLEALGVVFKHKGGRGKRKHG